MNIEALNETADYCNHIEYVQTNKYISITYTYMHNLYAHPHAYTLCMWMHNVCILLYSHF